MTAVPAESPPRVLIESPDPVAAARQMRLLREAGVDAEVCRGPHRLPQVGCPLLTEGTCAPLTRADAVLFDLDVDDPVAREVLAVLRLRHAALPVVAEVPTETARRHAEALAGCVVVPPVSDEHLVAAVVDALAARGERPELETTAP